MPWEDKTVEELRKEFVEAAKVCSNFSSLCREFGITRKTGYKWIERDLNLHIYLLICIRDVYVRNPCSI